MQLNLIIRDFNTTAIIGVKDFERIKAQKIIINAKLGYKFSGEYIDYEVVANFIKDTIINNQYEILELAVLEIKELLIQKFNFNNVQLEILKPEILPFVVGVSVE